MYPNAVAPRETMLQFLNAGDTFDVLVIGGGIVGAGIARDAAMRGLKTALVEQYDFAGGTSSRTSRMLHGGLRYLIQGRLGLVREASREKIVLQQIAPHLCEPMAFVFPTYRGTDWPRWKVSVGVKFYDLISGKGNLGKSYSMNRKQTLGFFEKAPLREAQLTGSVRYYDAMTNDARLTIDTVHSAVKHGAIACNYVRFESARPHDQGWRCKLRNLEKAPKDAPLVSPADFEIQARTVVAAAGPWAAKIRENQLGLRLTKGVHLVVERAKLDIPDAVVMTERDRILFAIPWGDRIILGTTDTDFMPPDERAKKPAYPSQDPLSNVRAELKDIQYILDVINKAFPCADLKRADVQSWWAGLRPLIDSGESSPTNISRAHQIRMSKPGWLEVGGGKLTTHRLMAEQTVDMLYHFLIDLAPRGIQASISGCSTAQSPLLEPSETRGISTIIPPAVSRQLVHHYCAKEWAIHLDDIMLRRTSWQHYAPNPSIVAEQVALWMAEVHGWDEERMIWELRHYRQVV